MPWAFSVRMSMTSCLSATFHLLFFWILIDNWLDVLFDVSLLSTFIMRCSPRALYDVRWCCLWCQVNKKAHCTGIPYGASRPKKEVDTWGGGYQVCERVDLISGFDIFIEWLVQWCQWCHRLVKPTMMTLRVRSCAQADADVDVAILQGTSAKDSSAFFLFI